MNTNLWGIVKGTEVAPVDPNTLKEWENKDDKEKFIIILSLLDSEIHHVDMDKSSKEIWENLNKLFRAREVNGIIFLKLQLFIFKIPCKSTLSSHVNNVRSIIRELVEFKAVVDEEDSKAILWNNFPPKYNSEIFTLSQLPSQSLYKTIATFLA